MHVSLLGKRQLVDKHTRLNISEGRNYGSEGKLPDTAGEKNVQVMDTNFLPLRLKTKKESKFSLQKSELQLETETVGTQTYNELSRRQNQQVFMNI